MRRHVSARSIWQNRYRDPDEVPSPTFATSANVPSGVPAIPAGCSPTVTVAVLPHGQVFTNAIVFFFDSGMINWVALLGSQTRLVGVARFPE